MSSILSSLSISSTQKQLQFQPIIISLLPLIPIILLSYTARWFYNSLQSVRAERRRRISGESGPRPERFTNGNEKLEWSDKGVVESSSEDEVALTRSSGKGMKGKVGNRGSGVGSVSVYEDEGYLRYFPDLSFPETTGEERQQIKRDKEMYHKLQNLEDHPGEFLPLCPFTHP
jgi:hypothetical protein